MWISFLQVICRSMCHELFDLIETGVILKEVCKASVLVVRDYPEQRINDVSGVQIDGSDALDERLFEGALQVISERDDLGIPFRIRRDTLVAIVMKLVAHVQREVQIVVQ